MQCLHSLPVGVELNWAKAGSKYAAYSCRKRHNVGAMGRGNTDHSRRSLTTSVTVGRSAGSCRQHLSVMSHTESVRPSSCASCGRAGRSPPIIFRLMAISVRPLNGYPPVKTLTGIQMSGKLYIPQHPMRGTRTNLNHGHTKRKNVCFRCRFITFLKKDLRRSPCGGISLYSRYKNRV